MTKQKAIVVIGSLRANQDAMSENVPSTSTPSKDSDQPAPLCSLIRIFLGIFWIAQGANIDSEIL